jgi:hypothetical protein
MNGKFIACKQKVHNRGRAPDSFLEELVAWGRSAPAEVFAKNNKFDTYSSVVNQLGPWQGDLHRRAVMLDVLRVLGGFESSWDWKAGVDTTNPTSNIPCTEETGLFQCSGNSMAFSPILKPPVPIEIRRPLTGSCHPLENIDGVTVGVVFAAKAAS